MATVTKQLNLNQKFIISLSFIIFVVLNKKVMVRITEELIRKKSEHNECLIGTLEEIALHQEDIDKIEHIQHWAKGLKILLLQHNLISKIENLHKLKSLEYLNLSINNIEIIENLEGLESLQKLDLTLNFIGVLTSVECLKNNYNLENLFLTGNPCTDFEHYRDFVIGTLPQLKCLDGTDITHSDRISAMQKLSSIRHLIKDQEMGYLKDRYKQKLRVSNKITDDWKAYENLTEDEKLQKFWQTSCEHSPEIRYEMSKIQRLTQRKDKKEIDDLEVKPQVNLFSKEGKPYCMNQPKIPFQLLDKGDRLVLDLAVYKHLDSSLCDIDVQPRYVRVTIKKKIFQLALDDEINISKSSAQRSQITGHLVITLMKLNPPKQLIFFKKEEENNILKEGSLHQGMSRREFLEIGGGPDDMDFSKIVENCKNRPSNPQKQKVEQHFNESDVPPLE